MMRQRLRFVTAACAPRRALAAEKDEAQPSRSIDGFSPAFRYNGIRGGLGIAIDPAGNRFAVSGVGPMPLVYDFTQLIAVEVECDGATITITKWRNKAAAASAGAVLPGAPDVALGVDTRSRPIAPPAVIKLSMKIYVSDPNRPCHEIVFYQHGGGGANSGSNAAIHLGEWYDRFCAVLAVQEKTDVSEPIVRDPATPRPHSLV